MKLIETYNIILELFDSKHIYPYQQTEKQEYDNGYKEYRYKFKNKFNEVYDVTINIKNDVGKLDFLSYSPESGVNVIGFTNQYDAIKVFNTLKDILFKHKKDMKFLAFSSTSKRIVFYEKLLKYFGISYDKPHSGFLLAKF